MITRTTNLMRMETQSRHLQAAGSKYATLQNQATSGKRIQAPSDDPSGSANLLGVHKAQASGEQYTRNIADALGWLTTIDSSLMTVNSQLSRARDLAVQGANDGSMSPQAKEAIALELTTIKDSLLKETSANYQGRSVYAGTSDTGVVFNDDYSYNGIAGSSVERRLGDGATIKVDADGAAIFGTGTDSIFAKLDGLISDLRAGVPTSARIGEIDKTLDDVRKAQSTIGARHNVVLTTEESLATRKVDLEDQRVRLEDIDLPTIIMELQMQELTYQTALSVTAKSNQHNLMDFLR
ncbi:flagellin N-terminal helical domain-containing protein [Leifsonia sp. Leaf264]|uniref:flagellin N-terminal helical domain-containing protein n=1 Tax=Leifsonia sp. Leaf264 TaxID=1736314 RepID=UPI00072658B9|nr:flagellin [Leifsonia sp. Leaf264]KQO98254.1 hypothetical protein ASF30_09340 [Leifsonia sp. Leaf264]